MQQDLSTVRAIGVRGQKAQQRILHEREVDRLAIERHLVGGKVDSEVIHGKHLIDRNGLALAQKLACADLKLGISRARADEIGADPGGKVHLGDIFLIDDQQHGRSTARLEPLGHGVHTIGANAVGVENQQVEVVRRCRRIGRGNVHLDAERRRERPDEIMQPRSAGHEQHCLFRHELTSVDVILSKRRAPRIARDGYELAR